MKIIQILQFLSFLNKTGWLIKIE